MPQKKSVIPTAASALFADAEWRDPSSLRSVIPTVVEGPLLSFCHPDRSGGTSLLPRHFERGARFSIDAAIAKLFSSEMATRGARITEIHAPADISPFPAL